MSASPLDIAQELLFLVFISHIAVPLYESGYGEEEGFNRP